MTDVVDFLVRLKKIESARLSVRHVFVLWAVRTNPGLMGNEVAHKLGYKTRSNVQLSINRLVKRGLLEDRRIKISSLTPNDLHITVAGEQILNDVVPG